MKPSELFMTVLVLHYYKTVILGHALDQSYLLAGDNSCHSIYGVWGEMVGKL